LVSLAFVTLADALVDEYDVLELLNRLADFAVQLLPADAAALCWAMPARSCARSPPPTRPRM